MLRDGPREGAVSPVTTIRRNYQLVSAIALVIGVALITIAEAPSFHWTRIFGATAISLGALGVGVYVGLTQPGRYAAARVRISAAKQPIGIVVLLLLFLPALVGLGAGALGLLDDPDGTGWVVATGGLILILMLIATVAAFVVGVLALSGASNVDGKEGA